MNKWLCLDFWFSKDVRKYLLEFCDDEVDQRVILDSHDCLAGLRFKPRYKDKRYNPHTDRSSFSEIACEYAAGRGYLKLLEWSHSIGIPWSSETCEFAAACGQLETLQWLRSHPMGPAHWNRAVYTNAAAYGHLHVLQWCFDIGCVKNMQAVCDAAALHGQLEILKWAHDKNAHIDEHPSPIDEHTFSVAERGYHKNVVEWLLQNDQFPKYRGTLKDVRKKWPDLDEQVHDDSLDDEDLQVHGDEDDEEVYDDEDDENDKEVYLF